MKRNKKIIDPVDVKAAVKRGELEAYIQIDYKGEPHMFLRDTETGETVDIGGKDNEAE